jgi:hypothetical protein
MTTDAPAPEWAVYMASEYLMSSRRDDWRLARLLATLRERTLREAAGVCLKIREAYIDTADKYIGGTHTVFGSKGAALGEGADAILSLIAQPPKPERSDGSEAEGREEAT